MAQERWNGERGDVMSRRALIKTLGVAAGATVVGARLASPRPRRAARRPRPARSPPRHATSAPAVRPPRTSPILTRSSSTRVQRLSPAQRADPAPVDGRAVVGRPGVERPGALPGLERHPEQPPAALARGRRRVSVFRAPSNNSNGNTFDFQGRQLSCEHLTRRVVRYEHDGSVTSSRRRSAASA